MPSNPPRNASVKDVFTLMQRWNMPQWRYKLRSSSWLDYKVGKKLNKQEPTQEATYWRFMAIMLLLEIKSPTGHQHNLSLHTIQRSFSHYSLLKPSNTISLFSYLIENLIFTLNCIARIRSVYFENGIAVYLKIIIVQAQNFFKKCLFFFVHKLTRSN